MPNVLQEIVEQKQIEVAEAKQRRPMQELERAVHDVPPTRGFVAAIRDALPPSLIAEVKRASPSAGEIRGEIDPVTVARLYAEHGATCISVLTDRKYFRGSLDDLIAVKQAVELPILRKDFLIDRYQVLEARVAGADCVLLIAECLDDCRLRDLFFYAVDLELDVLIEVYDPENVERVLKLEPMLVGVNNRDLRTFDVDLDRTLALAPRITSKTLLVSESGIRTRDDVAKLAAVGVNALLIGETLMRSHDIGGTIQELFRR